MRTFYQLLTTGLAASTTNNFVWFALVFWLYLETESVIATGVAGGLYFVASSVCSFWFGSLVDNHKKKHVLIGSSISSLVFFATALAVYLLNPESAFQSLQQPVLWVFAVLLLFGTVSGSMYNIAIPTLVTILVPEKMRDKANGMYGMVLGIAFSLTSVASGLVLGNLGMAWVLISAVVLSCCITLAMTLIPIPEKRIAHTDDHLETSGIDITGTWRIVTKIEGLLPLILLTTFNNLLGGVFMALMDAYGLTLVTVQQWGLLWGLLSTGFIFGGLYISRFGLGKKPLTRLFTVYLILWTSTIFFTIQPSLILLAIGIFIWLALSPFIEATEQTVIQKVVPPKRQGRVFGFAHSVEQAASPLTAFIIGPVAQTVFIPFMTTGAGVELIGNWFGVGPGRGMALLFTLTGIIGFAVTLFAKRLPAYKKLAQNYSGT